MEQVDLPLRRQSTGMRVLRIAVLTADTVSLLFVLFILFLPVSTGQDGEAWFWGGLLLVYALFLVLGLTVALNVVHLVAAAFMHRRYDNGYGKVSRALLFLLPAAIAGVIIVG